MEVGGRKIRIAVVSGLSHAEPILKQLMLGNDVGYDLIEVMACPGGCICGAGHPVPEKIGEQESHQQVLLKIDQTSETRKSQENSDVLHLYRDFYGEPNSPLAEKLLHTQYYPAAMARNQ